jgi:methylated-DNA-[protein]-cysteine S-methyltransferase
LQIHEGIQSLPARRGNPFPPADRRETGWRFGPFRTNLPAHLLSMPSSDLSHTTMSSPIGELTIVSSDTGITAIYMETHPYTPTAISTAAASPHLAEAERQLGEYFAGERTHFDLPLAPSGTPFQRAVWEALRTIPHGETRSYAEIALQIGNPKGVRAVGLANGRNPISIVVPCHRVIGKNGTLTGYGGGLDRKRTLLELEGVVSKPLTRQRAALLA